tara:strand:- start:1805 stop:2029 length:225 start_codon:yes stop_codon:yes gene_type:complete
MSKSFYPEIYVGQSYLINDEIYDITSIRITGVYSKSDFTAAVFFKSRYNQSSNPIFEEAVKRIIGNPIFQIIPK